MFSVTLPAMNRLPDANIGAPCFWKSAGGLSLLLASLTLERLTTPIIESGRARSPMV